MIKASSPRDCLQSVSQVSEREKKKSINLLHFKFNLLGLAASFCVHGFGQIREGWTQSIRRSFFHHECSKELPSPTVKFKCHLAEIYNVELELEASFSQSYSTFNLCPEDTDLFLIFFLPFSSKCKSFDFPQNIDSNIL